MEQAGPSSLVPRGEHLWASTGVKPTSRGAVTQTASAGGCRHMGKDLGRLSHGTAHSHRDVTLPRPGSSRADPSGGIAGPPAVWPRTRPGPGLTVREVDSADACQGGVGSPPECLLGDLLQLIPSLPPLWPAARKSRPLPTSPTPAGQARTIARCVPCQPAEPAPWAATAFLPPLPAGPRLLNVPL